MRGETVDFDLFEIKNKILSAPLNENIKQRERFIDKKRRRSTARKVDEMLAQQKQNEESVRAALKKSEENPPSEETTKSSKTNKRQIKKAVNTQENLKETDNNEARTSE